MVDLQARFGLAYLFIAHDLRIVEHISDEVAVMYLGRIVESAPTPSLFATPMHPYTQALLAAIPVIDPQTRRHRVVVPGDLPSPASPPPGCRFHTRGPVVVERCRTVDPPLVDLGGGHLAACHLASPGSPAPATPDLRNPASG
ncbi:MAG TPA: oligopeptide/dipeptide ABC transporter ATP-binding protein, partial [Candidatus Polarisedimenticolia bacterium]|nr:oligopeptide/dipeptide ABC transporter ATP-binding protein [Candidatus Polarisedimenticolia bacterium]